MRGISIIEEIVRRIVIVRGLLDICRIVGMIMTVELIFVISLLLIIYKIILFCWDEVQVYECWFFVYF